MRLLVCFSLFGSIAAISLIIENIPDENMAADIMSCFPSEAFYLTIDGTVWLSVKKRNSTLTRKCLEQLQYYISQSVINPKGTRVVINNGTSFPRKHFRMVEVGVYMNKTNGLVVLIDNPEQETPITVSKLRKGMDAWHSVAIGIAVVMLFALAILGAHFMLILFRRRLQSSASNRQEITTGIEQSPGPTPDYDGAVSQKIERLRESLNKESQSSVARRQASHTSFQDELIRKADLETLEEKRTMDDFLKKMRGQFPELTERTQEEIVDEAEKKLKSRKENPQHTVASMISHRSGANESAIITLGLTQK